MQCHTLVALGLATAGDGHRQRVLAGLAEALENKEGKTDVKNKEHTP
jgi:hypothetical protein